MYDQSLLFNSHTFIPNALLAGMSDVRRNTLINICTTAQKSSDLGTIRNIASPAKECRATC
jgi:hypothetical protein